jgi:hypothetical protein
MTIVTILDFMGLGLPDTLALAACVRRPEMKRSSIMMTPTRNRSDGKFELIVSRKTNPDKPLPNPKLAPCIATSQMTCERLSFPR